MTDWSDPITYTAIVGAVSGIVACAGVYVSYRQWRDTASEAKSQRAEGARRLKVGAPDFRQEILDNRVLLEVTVKLLNPSSLANTVEDADVCIFTSDGDEICCPVLKPERRAGRGPWVLGNHLVAEDAIGVPINVDARKSVTGRLYFQCDYETFKNRRDISLQLTDMKDNEYRIHLLRTARQSD